MHTKNHTLSPPHSPTRSTSGHCCSSSPPTMNLLLYTTLNSVLALVLALEPKCSTKWLSGYRLASAQPQKTLLNLSLKDCEDECVGFVQGGVPNGCAAFAFGTLPPYNNTCELALAPTRSSRAIDEKLNMSAVDKAAPWDVYVLGKDLAGCGKRSYLFQQPLTNVPIDCFYRLLSGKRLSKPHALKSVSVSSLPECQDACIREATFSCRSVSYRYMPSGYSYSVANCELSPFYMAGGASTPEHDFVDDFDYDYFQREPYCKTSSGSSGGGAGSLGVCAVVVRRGGRMAVSLIKSHHQVTTPSQCEHLCTTSLFRCRAFAFRHTDRGHSSSSSSYRDPFHRQPTHHNGHTASQSPCQLYDAEFSTLPSYNVEGDPDYDLYEMGRMMGGECMLSSQWGGGGRDRYRPVTSTANYPPQMDYRERDYYGGRYNQGRYPDQRYPSERPMDREIGGGGYYPHHQSHLQGGSGSGSGGSQLLPGDRTNYFEKYPMSSSSGGGSFDDPNRFPTPGGGGGSLNDKRDWQQHHPHSHQHQPEQIEKPPPPVMQQGGSGGGGHSLHHYDRERPVGMTQGNHQQGSGGSGDGKGCLRRVPTPTADAHLVPDLARATFPVKTLDECSQECLRSMQVLRFPCRVLAFRHTSHTGGTCQLSATPGHTLRDQDFVTSHSSHSREGGVVLAYDEGMRGCERYDNNRRVDDWSGGGGRYGSGSTATGWYGSGSGGSSTGWYDRQRDGYYNQQNYGSNYPTTDYRDRQPSYNTPFQTTPTHHQQQYYPQNSYYHQPQLSLVQRHTVDGEPCLRSCVRNADAGFYYCQTDHEGAWNFCCRPDDGQCGYSRGLSFAWCYVGTGPSRDVWRTCKRTHSSSGGPPAQYLHDSSPPKVVRLKGEAPLGNLSVSDAVDLLERQEGATNVVEILGSGSDKNDTTTVVLKE